MNKAAIVALLAIGLVAMAGCKGTTSRAEKIPGMSDEDAFRFMSSDSNLLRCGDRFFQMDARSIAEVKEPAFDIQQTELTKADSLNGVTWHAMISLRAAATRSYI